MKHELDLKKNESALCILSGGLDSAVCLGIAISEFKKVSVVFFNYGQKTYKREKWCVEQLINHYDIQDYKFIDIRWLKSFGVSALFDTTTKLTKDNEHAEYVPFRNSILLSIASAFAESKKIDVVYIGSTGGDHICPDNSPNFIAAFQKLLAEGTMLKKDIAICAPLLNGDKRMGITIGIKLSVPFELSWSCHNNNDEACGTCSNCRARLEAFHVLGIKDPITYVK